MYRVNWNGRGHEDPTWHEHHHRFSELDGNEDPIIVEDNRRHPEEVDKEDKANAELQYTRSSPIPRSSPEEPHRIATQKLHGD